MTWINKAQTKDEFRLLIQLAQLASSEGVHADQFEEDMDKALEIYRSLP
jgi:hypothetical protein